MSVFVTFCFFLICLNCNFLGGFGLTSKPPLKSIYEENSDIEKGVMRIDSKATKSIEKLLNTKITGVKHNSSSKSIAILSLDENDGSTRAQYLNRSPNGGIDITNKNTTEMTYSQQSFESLDDLYFDSANKNLNNSIDATYVVALKKSDASKDLPEFKYNKRQVNLVRARIEKNALVIDKINKVSLIKKLFDAFNDEDFSKLNCNLNSFVKMVANKVFDFTDSDNIETKLNDLEDITNIDNSYVLYSKEPDAIRYREIIRQCLKDAESVKGSRETVRKGSISNLICFKIDRGIYCIFKDNNNFVACYYAIVNKRKPIENNEN